MSFFIFHQECCDTIEITSNNPIFTSFAGFGVGTYRKDSVDSRDRIIYRNSDYNVFGLGDYILLYEGPNEGGRQNWLVGTHKLKYRG